MEFILRWLATAIATFAAIGIVPGISVVGGTYAGPIACSLILSLVNVTIKPILQILGAPITILTLGIFYLIINALLLELSSWLSRTVFGVGISIDSFASALLGSIIISIVFVILSSVFNI